MLGKKERYYWNKERCGEEALNFKNKTEFRKKSKGAYESARKNGWLNDICSHMYKLLDDVWTKKRCLEVIQKCETKKDFKTNFSSAYQSSIRNKWLDEICANLKEIYKPSGYWTKDKCFEVAKTCKSIKDFKTKYATAYSKSLKNKWSSDIYKECNFIKKIDRNWIVYSYIILNKYIYVGITVNEKSRISNHLTNNNSSVYKFIKNNNIDDSDIKYKKEKENIVDDNEAKIMEKLFLEKYINLGYIKLNIKPTGNLGSNILYWTKYRCEEVAKLCRTKIEFIKTYNSAYNSARKHKWLDDICKHMIVLKKPIGFWKIKENCRNEAMKYKTKKDFKKSFIAYKSALENDWMEEFFPTLFNKENCRNEAMKYKTKKDFLNNNKSLYNIAYKRGWLDEICEHMINNRNPKGYWTKEKCLIEALKYNNKKDFKINNETCYNKATTKKWLDEICSHMINYRKQKGYWTKYRCLKKALKYNKKTEFILHDNAAYLGAKKLGCLDEICSHMIIVKKPKNYWSKEKCEIKAKKYKTKIEFLKNDKTVYDISYKQGWLNEICSHMSKKSKNI
jgi:hypothetical protein